MTTALWVLLVLVALVGAVIVIRVLAKVAAAAKDLQRNVTILSQSVASSIQHMGADVEALGGSLEQLRRRTDELAAADGEAEAPGTDHVRSLPERGREGT